MAAMLASSAALAACADCSETVTSVDTRIYGVLEDRAERLADAAVVTLSSTLRGDWCVDVTVAALGEWAESMTPAMAPGGGFCGDRPSEGEVWFGTSGGAFYVPPSYKGLRLEAGVTHGHLIYGVAPSGVDAVVVTKDAVENLADTDENAGTAAFVVWWRDDEHPGSPLPTVTVRPAS